MIQQSQSDRGVSELLGYSLLVGIVITTAVTAVILGMPILQETQENQAGTSTELAMQEVDSRLSSISTASVSGATEFSFGGVEHHIEGEPKLHENSGQLTVTVNENATCSVTKSLDSIWVKNTDGNHLAYEAGGVFRQSDTGSTWVVTPPSVSVRGGHVDISLANLTGSVSMESNKAIREAISSRNETNIAVDTLLQDECRRPDNITVQVESEFYEAWANHFQSQIDYGSASGNSHLSVDDSAQTATVYLNQDALPRATDDEKNQVLDFSGDSSFMTTASVSDDEITLEKGSSTTYEGYTEPINEPVEIARLGGVSGTYNVSRKPLDVVFVVDESGSMDWGSMPAGETNTRMEAAKEAIRNTVPKLDSSMDRVGVVGYKEDHSNYGKIYRTNGKMLTSDFGAFTDPVDGPVANLSATPWGGTFSAGGTSKATSVLSLMSDESRKGVIIFLSDGGNSYGSEIEWWANNTKYDNSTSEYNFNGHTYDYQGRWVYDPVVGWQYLYEGLYYAADAATIEMTRVANRSGVNTYSVGFGEKSGLNEILLRDIAVAGGTDHYYWGNETKDLKEIFDTISERVTTRSTINRTPITTTVRTGGTANPPQIVGNKEDIANVVKGGKTYYNVNDPLAPSTFSHGFGIDDGDSVEFSASIHGCDEWDLTESSEIVDGEEMPVLRCADMNGTETTIDGDNVTIYQNGDSSNFTDMLDNTETTGVQPNMTTSVVDSGLYDPVTEKLMLESNQAIVLIDFPDNTYTDNRLLLLYEAGFNEKYRPDGVIDFEVTNVKIEG